MATCSYAAQKFGVHSGMSIKDADRLCPAGIRTVHDVRENRETVISLLGKHGLLLLSIAVEAHTRQYGLHGCGVTYANMKSTARTKAGDSSVEYMRKCGLHILRLS